MKIYSVTTADARYLWTSFQSAAQSHSYWLRRDPNTVLEAVHVPDDAWKPVDKRTESRLNRVATLWDELVQADQEGLDNLLDDLVKRLQPVKKPEIVSPLPDRARREAQAMLELDRLVDAG